MLLTVQRNDKPVGLIEFEPQFPVVENDVRIRILNLDFSASKRLCIEIRDEKSNRRNSAAKRVRLIWVPFQQNNL